MEWKPLEASPRTTSPACNVRPVDQLVPFAEAHAEAGQIELPRVVEPGHLGHLAAHQGAPGPTAALGDTGDDLGYVRPAPTGPTAT